MSKTRVGKGSCLCGSVQFDAGEVSQSFGACHCEICRKWVGGPFMSVSCGSDIKFTGKEHITVYDSSQWAERGFCNKCGTGLFYKLKEKNFYHIPVGILENSEGLKFGVQYFIDQKPEYYAFLNETTTLTKAEIFAKFAPPLK